MANQYTVHYLNQFLCMVLFLSHFLGMEYIISESLSLNVSLTMVSVSESVLYSRSSATSSPLYSGSTLDANEYTFWMSFVFLLKMVPSVICISSERSATS